MAQVNYTQPDFRNPTANPLVTVRPAPSAPALNLGPTPLPTYIENLLPKEDPQGTIRAGHSGR